MFETSWLLLHFDSSDPRLSYSQALEATGSRRAGLDRRGQGGAFLCVPDSPEFPFCLHGQQPGYSKSASHIAAILIPFMKGHTVSFRDARTSLAPSGIICGDGDRGFLDIHAGVRGRRGGRGQQGAGCLNVVPDPGTWAEDVAAPF